MSSGEPDNCVCSKPPRPGAPNQTKREVDPVTFDDEVQEVSSCFSGRGEQRLESVPPLPYEVRIHFIEKSLASLQPLHPIRQRTDRLIGQ